MKKTFNLVATAAAGLEAVVGREIRDLGIDCQVEMVKYVFKGILERLLQQTFGSVRQTVSKLLLGNFQHVPLKNYSKEFTN